jgi:hypothetical protein
MVRWVVLVMMVCGHWSDTQATGDLDNEGETMWPRKWLVAQIISVVVIVAAISGCNTPIARLIGGKPSTRILFIGNSFTSYNGGLDKQIEGLAPSSETARFDAGGYTLEDHWNEGKAVASIQTGKWNFVVLQEQSQTPVSDRSRFFEAARKFDREIKRSGATTILLMTWERPDSTRFGVTTANLENAYQTIGGELGARVASAGTAFARSLSGKPGLSLYAQDGHPTMYGTYLAACVLYSTIFRTSPVGNSFSDWSISSDIRAYLQQIAADTPKF